jgi:hypothetical protein
MNEIQIKENPQISNQMYENKSVHQRCDQLIEILQKDKEILLNQIEEWKNITNKLISGQTDLD